MATVTMLVMMEKTMIKGTTVLNGRESELVWGVDSVQVES